MDVVIEQGEFGSTLVLKGDWTAETERVMAKESIREITINYARGFTGSDIGFLRRLDFLEGLDLTAYNVDDLSPINELHNLRSIALGCASKTLIDFDNFPRLERCYIMRQTRTKGLFERQGLTHLSYNPFPAADAERLGALCLLQHLSLGQSSMADVKGLGVLHELRFLGLGLMRELNSLAGIEHLHHLEELRIQTCRKLRNINEVAHLHNLRRLWVENCGEIESLKPVESLVLLERIILTDSTNILDGDISPLTKLPYLKDVRFANRRHYTHRPTPNLDGLVAVGKD